MRFLVLSALAMLAGVFVNLFTAEAAHAHGRGSVQHFTFVVDLPEAARFDPFVAEEAYDEIRAAARRACRGRPGTRSLQQRRFDRSCTADLVAQVVSASGNPMLIAAYNGESPTFRTVDSQYARVLARADAYAYADSYNRRTTEHVTMERTVRTTWYG